MLSWNLELEWEIGYEKVADLRAEVRCRYGAGTAPIAVKTDFIRALNGPLTVHRLKRPFKSVPTTEGDVYRSQNMVATEVTAAWVN